MYENVTQLYANHYKSNPFNTQSSYDNINANEGAFGVGQMAGAQAGEENKDDATTKIVRPPLHSTTTSSPQAIDDYLQSEYQSFLHTIIQTLAATHVHTMHYS
jgi:hypothetical protein